MSDTLERLREAQTARWLDDDRMLSDKAVFVKTKLPALLYIAEAARDYVEQMDTEGMADDDAIRTALAALDSTGGAER